MEEKEYTPEQEKLFITGFNEGYKLRAKDPQILEALLNGISENAKTPRLEGVRAGSAQREHEQVRERLMSSQTKIEAKDQYNVRSR